MPKHASKGPDFLSMKVQATIRKAWNAGRKTITLDGRKYRISKFSKRVSFLVAGEHKSQTETWLRLNPANGELVPMAVIELKHDGNLRTAKAK